MNYQSATEQQLYTIAYHEPCSHTEKLMALLELKRREKQSNVRITQTRIKRKMT